MSYCQEEKGGAARRDRHGSATRAGNFCRQKMSPKRTPLYSTLLCCALFVLI